MIKNFKYSIILKNKGFGKIKSFHMFIITFMRSSINRIVRSTAINTEKINRRDFLLVEDVLKQRLSSIFGGVKNEEK